MNVQYLNDFEGLKFMPVTAQKKPIEKEWTTTTRQFDLSNCTGVGLICGALSNGIGVVDVDCKYDLTGKLFESYRKGIDELMPELFQKLVVQKTVSGGYHLIYRCSVLSGNSKLANRLTTEKERQETYKEAYDEYFKNSKIKDKTEEGAVIYATKERDNDKVRVLLETREAGGYIMTFPSKGYELIQRDYYGIMDITPEEREALHSIARQFNQVFEEVVVPKTQIPKQRVAGKSPFEDYNEQCDIVKLLTDHGWKFVKNKGNKIHFQRPGQTTAETSGNFDTNSGWFSVFTTSTEFEPNHGYRPYAVFAVLECNKDFSEASRRLYNLGFGERQEKPEKEKPPSTRVIQSRVDPNDNDLSFLATGLDYDDYLRMARDGTLPMGLTTGSPSLDVHFLLKEGGTEGSFVMCNGHDNTGKSVWIWWLQLLAAMYHGWKGIVFASENTLGGFMRKMIQLYWGKPIRGYNAMTDKEYHIAKEFIESHFKLIKAQEDLYNYKDIINMVKKAIKVYPDLKWGMIDPYNSLKIDLSGFSKLSTHEYHYEALGELRTFGQVNKFGWFINHHAVTESLRKLDKEGYPMAPHKADTEGGGKVANRADEFLTIHRRTQHPTDWTVTEIHVRKIKDTETGGRPTPLDNPILFRMNKNGCGFTEELPLGGIPVDPVQRWHQTRSAKTEEEKHWADRKDYQTFEQYKEAEQKIDFSKKLNHQPKIESEVPNNYVPDDEEAEALKALLEKDKPF